MVLLGKRLSNHREFQRFIRFALIGVAGTAVNFTLLIALKEFVGMPTLTANALYQCGG